MKNFEHIDATSVSEASSALGKGNAVIIAGGTDLLGIMKDEVLPSYPATLVNIKTIPNMDYIKEEGGMLKIGSLAKLADIARSDMVNGKYKALAESAVRAASPNLREMGTIGGNLCQKVRCWYYRNHNNRFNCIRKGGSTCFALTGQNQYHSILGGALCFAVCPSDTATALAALDATIVTNKRNIPIGDFYKVLGVDLAADEIVTEIQVPAPSSSARQTFTKIAIRKSIDFAVVSIASVIDRQPGTVKVNDARIVLGAVAPVPYRATAAEDFIKGKSLTEAIADEAAGLAVQGALDLGKNKYKIQIAKTLVKRALLAD